MTTPADGAPATPDPAAGASADQTPAAPADTSTTAVRDLATVMDQPPTTTASFIKGVITSVSLTASPPVCSIQVSGDTSTTVNNVRMNDAYTPVVGDTVIVGKQDTNIFIICQLNDSGTGAANGWQTPTLGSGFSTNGNSNGPIQYRFKVEQGDLLVQWRGSVALSGTPTAVCTVAAGYAPSVRRSLILARDPGGGTDVVGCDFNTDGTVALTGTTAFGNVNGGTTGGASPGGTTASAGGHSHTVFDDHTHSHGGAVSTTSFVDSGTDTQGAHTHTFTGTSHTHTFTPTGAVAAPVWVSFNNVEYFL